MNRSALVLVLTSALLAAVWDTNARAETTDGGAPVAPANAHAGAAASPDPPPLLTRHQWVLDVAYHAGSLSLSGSRRVELPKPTPTARFMGRFAVELYVGKELIERVRFDFPLLGAGELGTGARRWDAPPSFERQLSSRAAVMVPHSERATRARLVDRASGRTWTLPWPPAMTRDGGVPLALATEGSAVAR